MQSACVLEDSAVDLCSFDVQSASPRSVCGCCHLVTQVAVSLPPNSIAANPPEFFVIIRKSNLEYTFPNGYFFFRIMKIHFFSPLFLSFLSMFRRRYSMSTRHSQHSRSFCDFALQATICFPFLCMCASPFFSFRGHAHLPPPPPLGLTNCAGWQLCNR